jgi:hypothetical protein
VPSLVTNVWQLLAGPAFGALLRRLGGMMVGVCAGTWAGSGLIAGGVATRAATAALGATLLLYAAVGLAKPRLRVPPRAERWAGPAAGAATGLVTGATGVFVVPAVPYLGALGLGRDDLVQALGLSFTVSTLALAAGLAWHGALPMQAAGASLLALAPALAGMALGGRLRAGAAGGVPAVLLRRPAGARGGTRLARAGVTARSGARPWSHAPHRRSPRGAGS